MLEYYMCDIVGQVLKKHGFFAEGRCNSVTVCKPTFQEYTVPPFSEAFVLNDSTRDCYSISL